MPIQLINLLIDDVTRAMIKNQEILKALDPADEDRAVHSVTMIVFQTVMQILMAAAHHQQALDNGQHKGLTIVRH